MEADAQFVNWDGTDHSKKRLLLYHLTRSSKAFSQATFCEIGTPQHIITMKQKEDNDTECADGEQFQK